MGRYIVSKLRNVPEERLTTAGDIISCRPVRAVTVAFVMRSHQLMFDYRPVLFYSRVEGLIFWFLPLAAKLLTGLKNIGTGEMMARTSSSIMQSLAEIEERTSERGDKM